MKALLEFIERRIGIALKESQRSSLEAKLKSLMKERGWGEEELLRILRTSDLSSPCWEALLGEITVKETAFFRDPKQFEALEEILPEIAAIRGDVNVWCAGCATGEEPYSVAMVAEKVLPRGKVYILGTDIDPAALRAAEEGVYKERSLRLLPRDFGRHFERLPDGRYRLSQEIKERVEFRSFNLFQDPYPLPPGRKWDIILCRNVLIYFRREALPEIISKFESVLEEGGYLFLGYSESLLGISENFISVNRKGALLYRKEPKELKIDRKPGRLKRRREIKPEFDLEELVKLSEEGLRRERWEEAEELLRRVLNFKDLPYAHALLAYSRAMRGDEEGALSECRKLLSLDPSSFEAHLIQALLLWKKGKLEEAEREIRSALYTRIRSPSAHFLLAAVLEEEGRKEEAARSYENALLLLEKGERDLLVDLLDGDLLRRAYKVGIEKRRR